MKYIMDNKDLIKMKVTYMPTYENGHRTKRTQYCDQLSILHFDENDRQIRESILLRNCELSTAQRFTVEEFGIYVSVPQFDDEMSVIVVCNSCGQCKYTLLDKEDELISTNQTYDDIKVLIKRYSSEKFEEDDFTV